MHVDRIHPASLTTEKLDVAVVIDVLRATSTAIALLDRGVRAVRIVGTPQELVDLPDPSPERYLVFSELDGSNAAPGLDWVDNSPCLAEQLPLEHRLPVLVTTNGTRAVAAAMSRARVVLVASFVNLSSVARHLRLSADRVTLLPAGNFANVETRTEDERCADALEQRLLGREPDLTALLGDCRGDARVKRRIERHPELVHDVELALDADRYDLVATVVPARSGTGMDLIRAP